MNANQKLLVLASKYEQDNPVIKIFVQQIAIIEQEVKIHINQVFHSIDVINSLLSKKEGYRYSKDVGFLKQAIDVNTQIHMLTEYYTNLAILLENLGEDVSFY